LQVLGNEDLAAHYCVRHDELEAFLIAKGLPFHKDSCGNLWASCEQPERIKARAHPPISRDEPPRKRAKSTIKSTIKSTAKNTIKNRTKSIESTAKNSGSQTSA